MSTTENSLWTHQERMLDWALKRPKSALWAGMGTGKTRVALLWADKNNLRNVLVVCPRYVVPVWAEQANCWLPGTFNVIALTQADTKTRLKHLASRILYNGRNLIIINYEGFWRGDMYTTLQSLRLDGIIADEAHRLKAPGSAQSRKLATLAKHTAYRLALTGTPLPNNVLDVYGQFRFVDPTVFGTNYRAFAQRYAVFGWDGYTVVSWINQDELYQKIAGVAFEVRKEDVL